MYRTKSGALAENLSTAEVESGSGRYVASSRNHSEKHFWLNGHEPLLSMVESRAATARLYRRCVIARL